MSRQKSCQRLVENVLREIHKLPSGPFWVRDVVLEKRYSFPVTLNVGTGRHIYITPEIDATINSLSKCIFDEYFQSRKADFTNSEWSRMVKRAFGEALVNHDDEVVGEIDAGEVLAATTKNLRGWVDDLRRWEYIFGCHLCNISDLKPLPMGPVLFEPRLVWLERMHTDENISKISLSRIARAWQGKRLRKRRDSKDRLREEGILETVGACDFVCSVSVAKTGPEAGLQKALMAARLATTAISLAWEMPSSALDVMSLTFDREPHRQTNFVLFPNNRFGYRTSWTQISGGITELTREEWENLVTEFEPIFNCTGEVITYVTFGRDAVSRPQLLNVLFQALLWFHEGCREQVDLMAIVKFCAAMEALSCGRNEDGILNLVKSRLVVKDENRFRKDLVRIYRDGRSRTVHGTSESLGHDWSESRQLSERLARLCLLSCLERASEYPQLEDAKRLSDKI